MRHFAAKVEEFVVTKPLVASFYTFGVCNLAQIWDGAARHDAAMAASGDIFLVINGIRSRADKCIKLLPQSEGPKT